MAGLHLHLSQTKCRSNSTDKSAGLFSWSAIGQLRTNTQPIGATSTPHHRITIKEGEYPGNGTNKSTTGLAGPLQARTPRALQTSPKDVTSEGTRTLERDPGGANRHVDSQRWGHTRREPSGANRHFDSQRWGHTGTRSRRSQQQLLPNCTYENTCHSLSLRM